MKTTFISTMLAVALAFVVGCSTSNESNQGGTGGGPTSLLFGQPSQPYTALGAVSTTKVQPNRGNSWQGMLRRQGGAMGADAVIVDTSTLNNPNTPLVSGTAIKFGQQPQTQ